MNKRVIIVDFNHMSYNFYNSKFQPTARVVVNGEVITKKTAIPNGAIKNIHRWSNGGTFPTAVCFDRPVPSRKSWFQNNFPDMKVGTDKEYKGGRERMSDDMFEGIQDSEGILRRAGVSCFSERNYEADDLICACVKRAKEKYPSLPIDIITNDADLLPLVDDTVSVFLRSKKMTYAVDPSIEKNKYVQVTPDNYQEIVEDLSQFKGFHLPYNTVLLYKILRGDSSDGYKRKDVSALYPPKKFNAMIEAMEADGVDFTQFKYGEPQYKIMYRDTGEVFRGTMKEALNSPDKSRLFQKIMNPKELDYILEMLRRYSPISDEQLDHVEKVYWGMNLNQIYPHKDKRLARRAYVVGKNGHPDIDTFNEIELQKQLNPLDIKLNIKF